MEQGKKLIHSILRKSTSRVKNSRIDKKSCISYFCRFYNSSIGRYSYVANNCNIYYTDIGQFTSIGLGCNIGGGEHNYTWVSTSTAFTAERYTLHGIADNEYNAYKKTVIGNDVWIASNVIIKGGVVIKDGAVIGAGSVVTKDIGAYEIWAGNPAVLIKKRFEQSVIDQLEEIQWWNWDEDKLQAFGHLFPDIHHFLDIAGRTGKRINHT